MDHRIKEVMQLQKIVLSADSFLDFAKHQGLVLCLYSHLNILSILAFIGDSVFNIVA